MRKNLSFSYCIFALHSSNPDDTTWELPRAGKIFLGFPDFCSEKNILVLRNQFNPWKYWTSQFGKWLFICFALSPLRKVTILKMTWQKVQGSKSKFGCLWLRWTCFGRTNCYSLFYGSSYSGHSTLGAETSKMSSRRVGSKRLISGWDKRSEWIGTIQTSDEAFLSSYLLGGKLINQIIHFFISRIHCRMLPLYNLLIKLYQ